MTIDAHTSLNSGDIDSTHDANRAFGEDSSLIVARPMRPCCSNFWFTVPDGFYALVTSHGIQKDFVDANGDRSCVWPAGLHLGPPWLKVSHLVTKQTIIMPMSMNDCITKDNIPISINITTSFRIMGDKEKNEDPKNVYNFVHHLTPKGLEQQILLTQMDIIFDIVRKLDHHEIFNLFNDNVHTPSFSELKLQCIDEVSAPMKNAIEEESKDEEPTLQMLEENDVEINTNNTALSLTRNNNQSSSISINEVKNRIKRSLSEPLNKQGVEIIDVTFHNVVIPEESRLKLFEHSKVVANAKEEQIEKLNELLTTIQKEEKNLLEQCIKDEKSMLLKGGEYDELVQNMELLYQYAKSKQTVENMQAKTDIDVKIIDTESEYTVQKIHDAAKLEEQQIVEEAKAESAIGSVEANGEAQIIEALADMESAYIDADGQKAITHAEIVATPMMRSVNEHKSKMLKIKVHESLAENDRLVITGTSGGNTANKIIMADAALVNVSRSDSNGSVISKIIEELKKLHSA